MSERAITPTVAAVAQLPQVEHLQFPLEWFNHITFADGKPHLQAMAVLADTKYFYQPVPIKDAATGMILRYERSFDGELLQRSYAYYKRYGLTVDQARVALDKLEAIGVAMRIVKDRHTYTDKQGQEHTLYNVMFIALDVRRLFEISVPAAMQALCPMQFPAGEQGGGLGYKPEGSGIQTRQIQRIHIQRIDPHARTRAKRKHRNCLHNRQLRQRRHRLLRVPILGCRCARTRGNRRSWRVRLRRARWV